MSPVILLGLVVMWAVVLIPMWLKRHDEAEESRSVDRFTSAMHTLSRREAASDQRYVVMPHRSRSVDVHVSGATAPSRRAQRKAIAARRAAARAPLSAAARRRRTLSGLLIVTVLTFAAAMLVGGMMLWVPQLALDIVLAAFVANLIMQGRHAGAVRPGREVRAGQRSAPAGRQAPVARRAQPVERAARVQHAAMAEPVRVAAAAPSREVLFDQTEVAQVAPALEREFDFEFEPTGAEYVFDQTAELKAPAARYAPAEPEHTIELPAAASERDLEPEIEIGGRPWEPVPVPRPTYTTKPTAPVRRPRAPIFEPLLPEVEPAAELNPADDLEEILDRRWAVND